MNLPSDLILYAIGGAAVVLILGLGLRDSKDGYCLANKALYMLARFIYALAEAVQVLSEDMAQTTNRSRRRFVDSWKLADREAE